MPARKTLLPSEKLKRLLEQRQELKLKLDMLKRLQRATAKQLGEIRKEIAKLRRRHVARIRG
jgi:hypothetical protein